MRAWREIDLDAIPHNLNEIRKLVGDTKILGIVKDDAYGHGAIGCVRKMEEEGVDLFAVSTLEEALELRQAGISADILILGYTEPGQAHLLEENDLIQTLVDLPYARELDSRAKDKIRVHVKADTGMNRIGILWQDQKKDLDSFLKVYELTHLQPEGLFTHFPVSDDLDKDPVAFTTHQIELYNELTDTLKAHGIDPGLRHVQNSYGILNYGDLGMDYCRPGLLYMGVTSDDTIPIASDPDFIPVLEVKTVVTMVKDLVPGQTVSYGRHYTVTRPSRIASVAIGYGDGLPRLCSNSGLRMIVKGQYAPVVGNICMDQCMIDVTSIDGVKPGDIVTVIGKDGDSQVTVDEISRLSCTINNETLTRLNARLPKVRKSHDR